MLTYNSQTGETWLLGEWEGYGYSGCGKGRNNPDLEAVKGVGPIPRGRYKIWPAHYSETTGPITFDLTPEGHAAHGRTLLRIHGDNENHDASHGCIVLGRTVRSRIRDDRETVLEVV